MKQLLKDAIQEILDKADTDPEYAKYMIDQLYQIQSKVNDLIDTTDNTLRSANILSEALTIALPENYGLAIHHDGVGYCVANVRSGTEWTLQITQNDNMLSRNHGDYIDMRESLVTIMDEMKTDKVLH